MSAIMQTAGPVSNLDCIRQNWKFIRESSTSADDFREAAVALEQIGLGYMASFKANCGGRSSKAFIKRKPEEVAEILSVNPDLCDPNMYPGRYCQSPPKCIGLKLRSKLVALKLVSQKQLM